MALIAFAPLIRPVAFLDGSERLLDQLAMIADGWSSSPAAQATGEPLFTVCRSKGAFRIDAPWLDEPVIEPDAFRAAGNLAVDLAEAYLAENPALLSIHCAAALIGGRLMIFPSRSRAGKSMLSARLAAAGIPLFTDDLLVLTDPDDGLGMSLGLTARLRLPLPDGARAEFRGFVEGHAGPSDSDYLYLALAPELRPRFGRTAPIGAVVLLEREDAREAVIAPVSGGDGLQELILQNLSLGVGASDAVRRLRGLIERTPRFVLRYSDLDQACAQLLDRFGDWSAVLAPAPSPQDKPGQGERPVFDDDGPPDYRARAGVEVHMIDGGAFLVSGASDSIYRLDDISLGLWNLLREPTGIAEAVAILHGAFPDVERPVVDRDVRGFFAELAVRDLIETV